MHAKFKARKQNGFSIQWNSLKLQQWTQKEKKKRGCQNQNGCKLECFHEKLPAIHVGQQEDAGSKKGVIRIPCNFLACCDLELLGHARTGSPPCSLEHRAVHAKRHLASEALLAMCCTTRLGSLQNRLGWLPFWSNIFFGNVFLMLLCLQAFCNFHGQVACLSSSDQGLQLIQEAPSTIWPVKDSFHNFSEAWSHPGAPEVYTPNGGKGVCGNRTPHNPCLCSQLSQNDNRGTAKIHIQQANKVATSRTPEPVFRTHTS